MLSRRGADPLSLMWMAPKTEVKLRPKQQSKQPSPRPAKKHKSPGHRKLIYGEDIEQKLVEWVLEQKSSHTPLSWEVLQSYAQDLVRREKPGVNFSASKGWVDKFLHRNKLSLNPSLKGQGKVSYGQELEKKILEWVLLERPVTTMGDIQSYAQELVSREMPWLPFSASRGWLTKFLHRNSLCLQQNRVRKVIRAV